MSSSVVLPPASVDSGSSLRVGTSADLHNVIGGWDQPVVLMRKLKPEKKHLLQKSALEENLVGSNHVVVSEHLTGRASASFKDLYTLPCLINTSHKYVM